jgi:hypothetical protein
MSIVLAVNGNAVSFRQAIGGKFNDAGAIVGHARMFREASSPTLRSLGRRIASRGARGVLQSDDGAGSAQLAQRMSLKTRSWSLRSKIRSSEMMAPAAEASACCLLDMRSHQEDTRLFADGCRWVGASQAAKTPEIMLPGDGTPWPNTYFYLSRMCARRAWGALCLRLNFRRLKVIAALLKGSGFSLAAASLPASCSSSIGLAPPLARRSDGRRA